MALGVFGKCCSKSWKNQKYCFARFANLWAVSVQAGIRQLITVDTRFFASFYLAQSVCAKSGIFYASEY